MNDFKFPFVSFIVYSFLLAVYTFIQNLPYNCSDFFNNSWYHLIVIVFDEQLVRIFGPLCFYNLCNDL